MGKKSLLGKLSTRLKEKKYVAEIKQTIHKQHKQWYCDAFSTEPVDQQKAEQAVDQAYKCAGLKPPQNKIWCDSPLDGIMLAVKMQQTQQDVHKPLQDSAIKSLNYSLSLSFRSNVRRELSYEISSPLREELAFYYTMHIIYAMRKQLALPSHQTLPIKGFSAAQDAHWLAYYQLFNGFFSDRKQKRLNSLIDLAHACGWCWLFTDCAILSKRPTHFSRQPWSLTTGFLDLKEKKPIKKIKISDFENAYDNHSIIHSEYESGTSIPAIKHYWGQVPKELERYLPDIKRKWDAIYMTSGDTDKKQAESDLDQIYQDLKLAKPKEKKWFASPLAAAHFILTITKKRGSARALRRTVVPLQLREKIRTLQREKSYPDMFYQHQDEVQQRAINWEMITDQICNAIPWQANQRIRQLLPDSLGLANMDFLSGLVPETMPLLEAPIRLVENCSFWWGNGDIGVLVEKPVHNHHDNQGRLHAEKGAALLYPDGFKVYAWHGYPIEEQLIENRHALTADSVLVEKNAELRRIKMEIFLETHGADNIVEAFKATVLDDSPCLGLKRQLIIIDEERYLYCTNGSIEPDGKRRRFLLSVPSQEGYDWENGITIPPTQTAHEASAWTYGINPKRYEEQVRT